MNREILFRGKRVDGYGWVEGFYSESKNHGHLIATLDERGWLPTSIIPETVGQFTGLTDKNGRQIFEGDIATHGNQNYLVKWDDKNARFIGVSEFSWDVHRNKYAKGQGNTLCYLSNELKVIGNIHDNPELLEEKK